VNDLRDKARRAFYAIKRNINFNKPIRIWLKIYESVIEPIALYGCEVWGPLTNQDFTKWDKHQIETLHEEFCKNILRVQRKKLLSLKNPAVLQFFIHSNRCTWHLLPYRIQMHLNTLSYPFTL
jgi:hypothetical protein